MPMCQICFVVSVAMVVIEWHVVGMQARSSSDPMAQPAGAHDPGGASPGAAATETPSDMASSTSCARTASARATARCALSAHITQTLCKNLAH